MLRNYQRSACTCRNWRDTYAVGEVVCGWGGELGALMQAPGPSWQQALPFLWAEPACTQLFERLDSNRCVRTAAVEGGRPWCYVGKECRELRGGGKVVNSPGMSWKVCQSDRDPMLGEMGIHELFALAYTQHLNFAALLAVAYETREGTLETAEDIRPPDNPRPLVHDLIGGSGVQKAIVIGSEVWIASYDRTTHPRTSYSLRCSRGCEGDKDGAPGCGCLNWKELYASQEVKCGQGRELNALVERMGMPWEQVLPFAGREKCDDFEGLDTTACVSMEHGLPQGPPLSVAAEDAEVAGEQEAWCYVPAGCAALGGGIRVQGTSLSWKVCQPLEARLPARAGASLGLGAAAPGAEGLGAEAPDGEAASASAPGLVERRWAAEEAAPQGSEQKAAPPPTPLRAPSPPLHPPAAAEVAEAAPLESVSAAQAAAEASEHCSHSSQVAPLGSESAAPATAEAAPPPTPLRAPSPPLQPPQAAEVAALGSESAALAAAEAAPPPGPLRALSPPLQPSPPVAEVAPLGSESAVLAAAEVPEVVPLESESAAPAAAEAAPPPTPLQDTSDAAVATMQLNFKPALQRQRSEDEWPGPHMRPTRTEATSAPRTSTQGPRLKNAPAAVSSAPGPSRALAARPPLLPPLQRMALALPPPSPQATRAGVASAAAACSERGHHWSKSADLPWYEGSLGAILGALLYVISVLTLLGASDAVQGLHYVDRVSVTSTCTWRSDFSSAADAFNQPIPRRSASAGVSRAPLQQEQQHTLQQPPPPSCSFPRSTPPPPPMAALATASVKKAPLQQQRQEQPPSPSRQTPQSAPRSLQPPPPMPAAPPPPIPAPRSASVKGAPLRPLLLLAARSRAMAAAHPKELSAF